MNCVALLLYLIAEEGRENNRCPDDEEAGSHHHHDFAGDAFFPRIHLDINLEAGVDGDNSGNGIQEVKHVEHVLYFACNCTDNQNYVKSEKGKCSQNDTRIVLPMNEEKGCV